MSLDNEDALTSTVLEPVGLEVKEATAQVAEYPRVKDFFDKVSGGQSAPVVLVKQ